MRRLILPFALLLATLPAAPASAQEGPVELTLAGQSAWTSPRSPLELQVRAHNAGTTTLEDLSLTVALHERVGSRSEYQLSLTVDATGLLRADTDTLLGSLAPGTSRVFSASLDLEEALAPLGRAETGVFPVTVELRSGTSTIAVLRTPVVYLHERPANPLLLGWTFVLHAPIAHGPDGVFLSPALERAISIGAPVSARVSALARMVGGEHPVPVNVAISPTLVSQLAAMSDGYRVVVGTEEEEVEGGQAGAADAARVLQEIRAIAGSPSVQVSALPYGAPSVPAMVAAGMRVDLRRQVDRGIELVEHLTRAPVDRGVYVAPDSIVDEPSLGRMAALGTRLVLLDTGQASTRAVDRGFVPPPVADVQAGGSRTVQAVVPDPEIQALLASGDLGEDPRLGAQRLLGLLASTWLEQPGTTRGVAMMVSSRLSLPPSFYRQMVSALSRAPWLRRARATDLAVQAPRAQGRLVLAPSIFPTLAPTFVGRIRGAHESIRAYRSVLVPEQAGSADDLERLLLLAESGGFVGLERIGIAYVDAVDDAVEGFLAKVGPDEAATATLASRTGLLNVGLRNDTGGPVRLVVRLQSSRLSFLEGDTQEVLVDGRTATLTFRVRARTAGQFPVRVQVETPTGHVVGGSQIVVRSTAVSRVALLITLAAALYLVARWVRHLVRSRAARAAA